MVKEIDPQDYQSVRRPSGTIIIADPNLPMEIQADTRQCCHCGMHWICVKGSGKVRGHCFYCSADTCGSEACMKCVPYEKQLELREAGKSDL